MHDLLGRAWGILPKLLIAAAILVLAAFVARATRWLLRRTLRNWSRSSAFSALAGVVIYLLALGVALSVIVGDVRALVGSVGLTGLALSWALQTPIESFTGWLLNSFKGYYRIGDRIAVGDVFGDVYAIDFLTTTVWESGGPGKPVQGAQPTGALITFPNLEVLRNNIVNYTREFPQVWDEVTFGVANDSDLGYATRVIQQVAARIFGDRMQRAASDYRRILVGHGVDLEVSDEPQVYLALTDAWTNITVRYIVPARERRRWASELVLAVNAEIARPEHVGRIKPSYPRTQIEVLNAPGGDGIQQHTEDAAPSPQ
jgi:small-conductance mechanosensitive channel